MSSQTADSIDPDGLPSDADLEHFWKHGWWVSPPVLPAADLDRAERGASRLYAGELDQPLPDGRRSQGWKPSDGEVLRKNDFASHLVHDLQVVTRNRSIGAIAARLLEVAAIRLWHDQLLYKPSQQPDADSRPAPAVGWHTDRQYWQSASTEAMLTAWLPFHDIEPSHGPLTFVDGSHRWEGVSGDFFDGDLSLAHITAGHHVKLSSAVMPRGAVSFHHSRTIHGSGPNTSGVPRRSIAVHLQSADNQHARATLPDGSPATHPLDAVVGRRPDGQPDYADPVMCPQLWP